jgi:hypothetical protein
MKQNELEGSLVIGGTMSNYLKSVRLTPFCLNAILIVFRQMFKKLVKSFVPL